MSKEVSLPLILAIVAIAMVFTAALDYPVLP